MPVALPLRDASELARMGRNSGVSRRAFRAKVENIESAVLRLSRQLDAFQIALDAIAASKPPVQVAIAPPVVEPLPRAPGQDESLDRTRRQLSSIDAALDRELSKVEPHPKVVQSLASAKATLAELERRLDGRPLPATVRATARPTRNREPLPEPTPVEPARGE